MTRVFFSAAIGALYLAYSLIRLRAERAAAKRRLSGFEPGAKRDALELSFLTLLEIFLLVLFFLRIPLMEGFALYLPFFLRLLGLFLGAGGLSLIAWAGEALDGEYSSVLEFKADHRLITSGPYRLVRHPIYSGLCLLNLGVGLAAANLIIACVWILGLALVLLRRVPREERSLEARFGDDWRRYALRRGRFIPRPWQPDPKNEGAQNL